MPSASAAPVSFLLLKIPSFFPTKCRLKFSLQVPLDTFASVYTYKLITLKRKKGLKP